VKKNIIKDKSFQFSIKIVEIYKFLTIESKEFVMSKQLLRAGTSNGANVREAEHAESKADFTHKMSISLKEANETEYWLDLLKETGYLRVSQYENMKNEINELLRILISIVKSSKNS
jgi:four helix bundle protein